MTCRVQALTLTLSQREREWTVVIHFVLTLQHNLDQYQMDNLKLNKI